MVDGTYAVVYGSAGLEGYGTVRLNDGRVEGSDAGYKWTGTYHVAGARLTAEVIAEPERDAVNVFRDSAAVHLHLTGTIGQSGCIEIVGLRTTSGQPLQASLEPIEF